MNTTVAAMAGLSTMVADSRWGWPGQGTPDAVSSFSRCSTTYGASSPPWGPSTDYFTSTSYAYRVRTQVLTPKPSTTSVSTTTTYTQYETAPNNLTRTIYTDTYTWTNYLTSTSVVTSTSVITTSVLSSTTVPTPDGFTPVAAEFPQATQHVDDWADRDNWAVEDSYFQDEGSEPWAIPLFDAASPVLLDAALEAAPLGGAASSSTEAASSSGQASKVDCLVTLINVYDSGTSTSKSYVSPPTYTRTAYVATETITSTVRTKINPTETPYTFSMASASEIRSWYTETRTKTETVSPIPLNPPLSPPIASTNPPSSLQTTTTLYPSSTTTSYAACATNNIVDTYDGFPLDRLAADWYSKNLTIIRSDWSDITNATACCATAAAQPNAIFFKYDGICEVFVDDRIADWTNTSAKINVEVLYEPRERGWWGPTFGNGPRGSISFSSLWL